MKVLIVGAGPTGLTAALEFARRGIIPEIVDAKKSPSELSRAVGILPKSIEHLRASGVSDIILKESVRFNRVKIHRNKKAILDIDLSKLLEAKDLPVSLPQDRTESIMSDFLEKMGAKVQYNRKVVDIKTDHKEAVVTFLGGERKNYDWVIGSDGVNSTVREKLGIKYVGYDLSEIWSIADIDLNKEYSPESFSAWVLDKPEKDVIVMAAIGPKRVRLVSSTPDSIKALPVKIDAKNVRKVGDFKISIRQADSYVKGRVLLAGDSAHAHSPVGGRGMNLGIDDAVEAVESILEGKTKEYGAKRSRIGAKVIRDTERARKTIVSSNVFARLFVNFLFFLVQNFRPFKKKFLKILISL